MNKTTTLKLIDGVRVVVPDSLDLITTYVLREQEDWFEDEIKFLRCLLKKGQAVIDIGANYGTYTLSMANVVGAEGCVWAFEPATSTADLLAESIRINNFQHIHLEQKALSHTSGTAELSLHNNSELNELVRNENQTGESETVTLSTLDLCMDQLGWKNIDFLKLDAEGEESNILRGGSQFFETLSPLVQFEVKAGREFHLGLVHEFKQLGYRSYRLVPGLNLLAPFNKDEPIDAYLLNLFCCKSDNETQLIENGYMLDRDAIEKLKNDKGRKLLDKNIDWYSVLSSYPYGKACTDQWKNTMSGNMNVELKDALSFYLLSKETDLSATERYFALEKSYWTLKALCASDPGNLRLASLARVAREYGARQVSVQALRDLCKQFNTQKMLDVSEPFLAPDKRFDLIAPGNAIVNWVLSTVLETLELNSNYSSYYSGMAAKKNLELIRNLGFGSEEMNRRLSLLKLRFDVT